MPVGPNATPAATAAPGAPSGASSVAVPQAAALAPQPAASGATPARPQPAASGVASASASASAPAAARPGEPPAPRPFADVIKDAKESKGFFSVWRKDERVWLEIGEDQLGKPFLFGVNISNSVGERGLYASQMGPEWMVEFKKIGSSIQLVAHNTAFRASGDKAMETTVSQSFSRSLLLATPVVSAPHPTRKSILVDAAFLLADLPGYASNIEMGFRIGYAFDKANSYFVSANADQEHTTISTNMHFGTARIPLPPTTPPPPGVPVPTPPKSTPDPRSFFVGYVYSLSKLSESPMAVRLADPRIGHFATSYTDVSNDLKSSNRVHMINRWRLEKRDPKASMSEPVKPISYWIDKNVPQIYRKSVEAGILEWNKAFEAIGFKGAVVAKQQPDNATWDNMDGKHASIRWFTGADVGFAIGPSRTDPRSGEITDADIGMSDVFGRGSRRFITDDVGNLADGGISSQQRLAQVMGSIKSHSGHDHAYGSCNYALEAQNEMNFALDVLEARGDLDPNSPETEAFVQAVIKDTISHEVGHTLGFKHNFKASTTVSQADLRKPGLLASSVMDYLGYNIPIKGETKGSYNQTGIGPYDYWAVAYAYSQFAPGTEKAELAKIAARSTEPGLAYGDDAEAGGFGPNEGLDPLTNRFDQGDDPLAFYGKRLKLSRELWDRLQDRKAEIGDDPLRSRRSLTGGFRQLGRSAELVSKYIGGMHVVRDLPGTTARSTYTPVDPAKQRQALQFLVNGLFKADSFKFTPELLAKVGTDFNEWDRDAPFSIPTQVNGIQMTALNKVMGAGAASRLLNLPNFVAADKRKGIITLNEVYTTLQSSIWSELATGQDTDGLRRNLQRAHLSKVTAALTKPIPMPADALSLMRLNAQSLQADLQRAVAKSGKLSVETRAHYKDSLGMLSEAMKATMTRS